VKKGWIAKNPLEDITGTGQRNRGKKQLRIDEARKLVDVCLRSANEGDEAAVGVMTAFLLGLRVSEVTDRVVRDLDDNGRLLWIEFGKTRRSKRTLEVPALLRPYLLALAKGRPSEAQLISRTISPITGQRRDRFWFARHVERLCKEAGVPVVCTQSLRGLHASVATEAGATSHVVASALGHSSPAVTQAHYIDGAIARRVRNERVLGKVAPGSALHLVEEDEAIAMNERTETMAQAGSPTEPTARAFSPNRAAKPKRLASDTSSLLRVVASEPAMIGAEPAMIGAEPAMIEAEPAMAGGSFTSVASELGDDSTERTDGAMLRSVGGDQPAGEPAAVAPQGPLPAPRAAALAIAAAPVGAIGTGNGE
jgi:hypothetical protein